MRSQAKVSFHETGLAQWSRTDEWVKRTGARNSERHVVRWQMSPPSSNRASHVFRIIIPATELQIAGPPRSGSTITWIDPPPPGSASQIECYIALARPDRVDPSSLPLPHLTTLPLHGKGSFVVLHEKVVVSEDNLATLRLARAQLNAIAKETGVTLHPGQRIVAFLVSEDGARGMIEIQPSIDDA